MSIAKSDRLGGHVICNVENKKGTKYMDDILEDFSEEYTHSSGDKWTEAGKNVLGRFKDNETVTFTMSIDYLEQLYKFAKSSKSPKIQIELRKDKELFPALFWYLDKNRRTDGVSVVCPIELDDNDKERLKKDKKSDIVSINL